MIHIRKFIPLSIALSIVGVVILLNIVRIKATPEVHKPKTESYWFLLHRVSNTEDFYLGTPGIETKSKLVKTFKVKTGVPGERPTPLPQLLGKKYWKIIKKEAQPDNPESAPYFLTLNIPAPDTEPFGPTPYTECNGQCSWQVSGAFGLHGVASDSSKLSAEDPGSSGCIRHKDKDIAYLYGLLDPKKEEIRYYIQDN